MWTYNYTDELYHHGILGMKWGHRKQRKEELKYHKQQYNKYTKELDKEMSKEFRTNKEMQQIFNNAAKIEKKYKKSIDYMDNYEKQKKKNIRNAAIGIGVAAVGAFAVSRILKKKGFNKKISYYKDKKLKLPREMYDGTIKFTTKRDQIKDRIKNAPYEDVFDIERLYKK